jgi:hypothetical protein
MIVFLTIPGKEYIFHHDLATPAQSLVNDFVPIEYLVDYFLSLVQGDLAPVGYTALEVYVHMCITYRCHLKQNEEL